MRTSEEPHWGKPTLGWPKVNHLIHELINPLIDELINEFVKEKDIEL